MSDHSGKRLARDYRAFPDKNKKYGVSAKVDLYTHQALTEYANINNSGNLSAAVVEAIEQLLNNAASTDKMSAYGKHKIMTKRRENRERDRQQLERDYISLQCDYDAEFEEILKASAKEKGLKYPPDVTKLELWQTDDNLVRVYNSVKRTMNGNAGTTLREVYRDCDMSSHEALFYLGKLRDYGKVRFDDVATGQTCVITLNI